MTTERRDERGWALAAAGYELLAFSLRYPSMELAEALASCEWAEAAEELAGVLDLELAPTFAVDSHAAAGEDPEAFLHTLRAEATRLMVGAPEPAVSPFEGVWRAKDDGVPPLLFVSRHSVAVERFCISCGLGRPDGTNEPLDHIATELELMQHLSSVKAGIAALPEAVPCERDLPGGSAALAYADFLRSHLLVWAPRFGVSLDGETRLPFYRCVSKLLLAFLERESAFVIPEEA